MDKSKTSYAINFKLPISCVSQFKNMIKYNELLKKQKENTENKKFLIACEDGKLDDVRKMIKSKKININYQLDNNKTGLIYASKAGNYDIVKLLVENNVDMNIQDINKNTALMFAILYHNDNIAEYLITQGAKLDLTNNHGSTVMHIAASVGNKKILEELDNRGMDLEYRDSNKNNVIFIAALNNYPHIVKYCISQNVKLNLVNNHLKNMLIKDENGNPLQYREKSSLLHICIEKNLIELLIYFISKNININIFNCNYETPLKYACKLNKLPFVKILLEKGADPNINSILNYSCLHSAIDNNNYEMVKLLIDYNADYNCKTLSTSMYSIDGSPSYNESILRYSMTYFNHDIINYLKSKNAIYYNSY
jgi:ankyrin repeat protein